MRKIISVIMSFVMLFALVGCFGATTNEDESNLEGTEEATVKEEAIKEETPFVNTDTSDVGRQEINHMYRGFPYFTIEYIPNGYGEITYEDAEASVVRVGEGIVAYEVWFANDEISAPPINLLFLCTQINIQFAHGEGEPNGEFLRNTQNGHWAIYQNKYTSLQPAIYLYPIGDNLVGEVSIGVDFDDRLDFEDDYYQQLLVDCLVLADGLSASTYTEEDFLRGIETRTP